MIISGLQAVRRPLQSTNPWFGHRVVMNGRCQVRRNLIWKLGESRLMGTQSIFLCNILIFYLKNDVYTKTTSSVFFYFDREYCVRLIGDGDNDCDRPIDPMLVTIFLLWWPCWTRSPSRVPKRCWWQKPSNVQQTFQACHARFL